ncbi:vam6/Vps39-like protein [Amphibalanus amphitrite]|uniref:vam6/Vps39-like protein n=1 Tax=Amphibalanus amphitrite TaxID=1232801 RepID=UPI001C9192A2|nr:vam6/Vps39-like protein [Amphibalanus amphitrite]XP_043220634.1 vam6/Vps39-like protein [Amphibalanus amphitrite]
MHEAYECIPILEKLPLQIESIATFDDKVAVGTKQGHLLLYALKPSAKPCRCDVQLLRSNKNFSKKAVLQVEVLPEYQTLICLSDNLVTAHDLGSFNFNLLTSIPRSKGASMFKVDIQRQTSLTGDQSLVVRLCVAVKRKLQLYYWKNREFHELMADLAVPDVPRALAWNGNAICVGLRSDYFLLKLSGEERELFPTGKSGEPTIAHLGEGRLALVRDQQTIFIDRDGNPTQKLPVTWSKVPHALLYDAPYLVALCAAHVEVQTVEPRRHIQTISWEAPRFMARTGAGQMVLASASHLWLLRAVAVGTQVNSLVQQRQFQLALELANLSSDAADEKAQQRQHIRNLYAFDLFTQKHFKEAMQIFLELNTDPSHVIGLFPDLLPQQYWSQLEYPGRLAELQGRDLENGLVALSDYLIQVRHQLMKDDSSSSTVCNRAIVEGSGTVRSRPQLLQIVDTTLLKCYLQTNSALVASLLRLKDNHCHLEETEHALKKDHKLAELIILYQTRRLHRRALELLVRHSGRAESALYGTDWLVHYLQHLGAEHMDLIEEFARPVLLQSPDQGLLIFTDDLQEVETLPRARVCEYLRRTAPQLLPQYLEHVINVWHETHPMFHNELLYLYRALAESAETAERAGHYRRRLVELLTRSEHYIPEQILVHFPHDAFFEERAILLGRLGRHEQALTIYVHILRDPGKALQYCRHHHGGRRPADDQVYLTLLAQLATEISPKLLGVLAPSCAPLPPDLRAAIQLLNQHGDKMDPVEALRLLPASLGVGDLERFLVSSVARRQTALRRHQLESALCQRQAERQRAGRGRHRSRRLTLSDGQTCPACGRRFAAQSAFALLPGGDVVHYACRQPESPRPAC